MGLHSVPLATGPGLDLALGLVPAPYPVSLLPVSVEVEAGTVVGATAATIPVILVTGSTGLTFTKRDVAMAIIGEGVIIILITIPIIDQLLRGDLQVALLPIPHQLVIRLLVTVRPRRLRVGRLRHVAPIGRRVVVIRIISQLEQRKVLGKKEGAEVGAEAEAEVEVGGRKERGGAEEMRLRQRRTPEKKV